MTIRPKYLLPICSLLAIAFISLISMRAFAQTSGAQSRITQPVDATKLAVMRGNVSPLARPQFDRGAAPASLPMDNMMLVLRRSPQQEAALETLLAQQQERTSPNYHKWLTPEQFGQQFGPSDQDIQRVTSWLQSQGFQVNEVSKGRTVIDFSGNAGQVQRAFHAAIHRYVFPSGQQHWANANDPEIPAALAPVVAGVNSLNDFGRKPMSHTMGLFQRSKTTGKITRVSPQFTYAGGCNDNLNAGVTGTNCFALGPADFNKIYNVPASATGAGQTIAIVADSDINETGSSGDVTNFRSFFGLPPFLAGQFRQIETGTDPGIENNSNNMDEGEAVLDVEWSGGIAPGANIDLVVSPSTTTTFGGDTSAVFVVDGNITPIPPILSYSFGLCELGLGTSGNTFYNNLWSQAATEGITVVVSTGDSGSAGCDFATFPSPGQPGTAQPVSDGLAVNGIASTPFNVAVGGTDFNILSLTQANTFFAPTNGSGQLSAKGYIPEIAYNDTCTNPVIFQAFGFNLAESACNNATVQQDTLVVPSGGGGGASNCTTPSGIVASTCSGGYAKPTWQTGPGVPNDGKRDIPDVSLFAGDGTIQSFYIACQADQGPPNSPNGFGNASCTQLPASPTFVDFLGVGGTSVSAQAFAGVMALVDQKLGGSQGNVNPMLYAMAGEQATANCNSTGSALPASTCVFNDVTTGTISVPCTTNSLNCTTTFANDPIGILSGFSAGTGFDLATGLGSMNVSNLLNSAGPNFYLSASNPVVNIASAGGSGTLNLTAFGVNGFTGTINLACSGLPTGASCSFSPSTAALSATTTSVPVAVAITTTAAAMAPANRPGGFASWEISGAMALALGLFASVLLLSGRGKQMRWNMALAVVVFALAVTIAACSGGSGSSNGPKPTSTVATVTGTNAGGSPTFSMNFTLNIQ